jgi:hypothetical protein
MGIYVHAPGQSHLASSSSICHAASDSPNPFVSNHLREATQNLYLGMASILTQPWRLYNKKGEDHLDVRPSPYQSVVYNE